jgi:hypothetical protein
MAHTPEPTANQRRVLEALAHHEHLLVLPEGNGVVPHLWVGSADINAMRQAGWIKQTSDLGSMTMWQLTPKGLTAIGEPGNSS